MPRIMVRLASTGREELGHLRRLQTQLAFGRSALAELDACADSLRCRQPIPVVPSAKIRLVVELAW